MAQVHGVVSTPGEPLPVATRTAMERSFGHSFGHVRIHADLSAAEAVRAVDATAWTLGHHIAFGAGRYEPASRRGLWLLAHELAHTIQQDAAGALAMKQPAASNDPGDRAADLAGDAVLAGRRVPVQPRAAGLQRQRITNVDRVNDNERVAHLDNGTRIRVRRVRVLRRTTSSGGRASAAPGIDPQRVWLDVDWCSGRNEGTMRIGANIPEQVLRTILRTVTSGGDIDAAMRQANVTPFAQTTITQSGRFSVTARGELTIDRSGSVTGGQGGVRVSSGPVDFEATLGASSSGGVQGGATVTITPGRETRTVDCGDRVRLVGDTRFECSTERDIPARQVPETVSVQDRHQRYVYFEYARDAIAPRSEASTAALATDLREGFQVSEIRAFTSPEGPSRATRTSRARRGRTGFTDNEDLARRRAVAAAGVVEAACRANGGVETGSCFVGWGDAVTPTGEGELYTLSEVDPGGVTRDVEGAELAQHAAEEFGESPAEAVHRTPEMEARLQDPSTSPSERADLVYPLLRRAEITLVRTRNVTRQREVPGSTESTPSSCPQDVIDSLFPAAMEGLGP